MDPHLVVRPARFPHAQSLSVRELPFKAEEDPAVTEEHLQAVLSQGRKVLVEAWVHEPQQLPQVHLQEMHVAEPLPVCQDLHPRAPPCPQHNPGPLTLVSASSSHTEPQLTAPAHRQLLTFSQEHPRPLQLFHKERGRVKRKPQDCYVVKRKTERIRLGKAACNPENRQDVAIYSISFQQGLCNV